MTVKLWDLKRPERSILASHDRHREFVNGIDFSLFADGLIATTSLDKRLCVFNALGLQPYI